MPQPPQLSVSALASVHFPLQSVRPVGQPGGTESHFPSWHSCPGGHRTEQLPQLSGSVLMSTHSLWQLSWPSGQVGEQPEVHTPLNVPLHPLTPMSPPPNTPLTLLPLTLPRPLPRHPSPLMSQLKASFTSAPLMEPEQPPSPPAENSPSIVPSVWATSAVQVPESVFQVSF